MDSNKVDMFIMTSAKMFPVEKISYIRDRLLSLDDSKLIVLQSLDFKDPTTILLVSIFVGTLGIDRFLIGDTGLGILKLLTGGVCGVLYVVDWFLISDRTKELNFTKLMSII